MSARGFSPRGRQAPLPNLQPTRGMLLMLMVVCGLGTAFLEGCFVYGTSDPCRCISPYPWLLYRFVAKNEEDFDRFRRDRDTITIDRIVGWQSRYGGLQGRVDSLTRRLAGTPEDTVYTLKGRVYYIRQMFDCDFHIEIGSMDTTDRRYIVCEVSVRNCYQQRAIKQYLIENGHRLGRPIPGGIPCIIVGLGFFDGQHGPDAGGIHASQWELHPVERVDFLEE